MSFSSVGYVMKETALSLRRNAWMGLASVITVAISLVILGFALTLVYNTNQVANSIESDIEISAFITLDTPADQVNSIKAQVENLPQTKSVEMVTKEQALAQFQQSLSKEVLENLGGTNPLPDKLTIKAIEPQAVKELAAKVEAIPGVEKVRYGQGIVDKIISFTHWVRWLGFGIIGILALASIVLISITIRLTVFARRREIQIMKFVGATDWFIRWPFLLEGLILGVMGAVFAGLVVVYGYLGLTVYLQQNLTFIPVIYEQRFVLNITLMLLGAGAVIGSLGSMISLRRFLKV